MSPRRFAWILMVFLLGCSLLAYGQWENTEAMGLTRQLIQARLGCIVVFVQHASDGKSRLLVGSGDSAELKVKGYAALPSAGWAYLPFATAYRVSEPFPCDIGTGVECRVLGAVVLGMGGEMLGTPQKINPGVYMLAFQPESPKTSKGVLLIDLRVGDDGRPVHSILGKGALDRRPTDKGTASPYLEAWLPDPDMYSDGSPYSRLNVDMAWTNESYLFRLLDMDIWLH